MTQEIASQMRKCVKEKFDSYSMYSSISINLFTLLIDLFLVSKTFGSQAEAVGEALSIVQGPSYGGLILNSKNEVIKQYFLQKLASFHFL